MEAIDLKGLKTSSDYVFSLGDYTNKISRAVNNIKKEYCFIGGLLTEVNGMKLYEQLGYESVIEYCESTFGFKKTFTYDLMKVYSKFNNGTIFDLEDKYKKYDYSKLVVMSSMNDYQLERCSPEYTVEQLRKIKKNQPLIFIDSVHTEKEDSSSFLSDNDSVHTEKIIKSFVPSDSEITLTFDRCSVELLIDFFEYCKSDYIDEIDYYKINSLDSTELMRKLEDCKQLLCFLNYNLENASEKES